MENNNVKSRKGNEEIHICICQEERSEKEKKAIEKLIIELQGTPFWRNVDPNSSF